MSNCVSLARYNQEFPKKPTTVWRRAKDELVAYGGGEDAPWVPPPTGGACVHTEIYRNMIICVYHLIFYGPCTVYACSEAPAASAWQAPAWGWPPRLGVGRCGDEVCEVRREVQKMALWPL